MQSMHDGDDETWNVLHPMHSQNKASATVNAIRAYGALLASHGPHEAKEIWAKVAALFALKKGRPKGSPNKNNLNSDQVAIQVLHEVAFDPANAKLSSWQVRRRAAQKLVAEREVQRPLSKEQISRAVIATEKQLNRLQQQIDTERAERLLVIAGLEADPQWASLDDIQTYIAAQRERLEKQLRGLPQAANPPKIHRTNNR